MNKRLALWTTLALLAGAALTGCNTSDHVEIKDRTEPPVPVEMSSDHFGLAAGIAVGFTAVPMKGDDAYGKDLDVEMHSNDVSVVRIDRTSEDRGFVVYGVGPGTASIDVSFDGRVVDAISVTVREQ